MNSLRFNTGSRNTDQDAHWSSISDLMSGLMIIFLFISVAYMNNVTKAKNKIENVAVAWNEVRNELYVKLADEFSNDLEEWQAEINRDTLSVRFREPSVYFEAGSSRLTQGFIRILDNFFPRYIDILSNYREYIAEVRIEGHTSSEWAGNVSTLEAYFRNMKLSQDRTRAVLQHCLNLPSIRENISWAMKTITANGLSSGQPIIRDGREVPELSRRVEFRVRIDSDSKILEILGGMK